MVKACRVDRSWLKAEQDESIYTLLTTAWLTRFERLRKTLSNRSSRRECTASRFLHAVCVRLALLCSVSARIRRSKHGPFQCKQPLSSVSSRLTSMTTLSRSHYIHLASNALLVSKKGKDEWMDCNCLSCSYSIPLLSPG